MKQSTYSPLKPGNEIRVIAPSAKFSDTNPKAYACKQRARKRLEGLGYTVTFGKYLDAEFHLGTARKSDRLKDLMAAYADPNVKAIIALRGGWSANELLPLIDWEVIQNNPKPLIGGSDITVLHNAILAKTGNQGYLGPNASTLGAMIAWEYTLDALERMLKRNLPFSPKQSKQWGEMMGDEIFSTGGWKVLQSGSAEGMLLGGNLGTFYLLQGTEFMPALSAPFIFALEDDDETGEYAAQEVSRRLESLLQQPGCRANLRGLIVGRFQKGGTMTDSDLESIISSKDITNSPVVCNVDFGHTVPAMTLPIGGHVTLDAAARKAAIRICQ